MKTPSFIHSPHQEKSNVPLSSQTEAAFVDWFRHSSPYIHAHRGRTFVIAFGGEMVRSERFSALIHDIALLNALGIRLVLVHGARPQIEQRMQNEGLEAVYSHGLRITDTAALPYVREAVGGTRVEIESQLSMGLPNSPMAGARIRVTSGNFVTARPIGVLDGIDFGHTGEVRRVDDEAIKVHLDQGHIVLLSPTGYSPTGEVFNLSVDEVASAVASSLEADKLLRLMDGPGLKDGEGRLIRELSPSQAERYGADQDDPVSQHIKALCRACRSGVRRGHLINRNSDGALLKELFTRDGIGTLITEERYEITRAAQTDDLGGILELIKPLEDQGVLVRRSRETLETEIQHFIVIERDGMMIGCAAMYPFQHDNAGELACLAIHSDYHRGGRGDLLLNAVEERAKHQGLQRLFVLTTRTAHWFIERGFAEIVPEDLPMERQALYNYQRRSKVFFKDLS